MASSGNFVFGILLNTKNSFGTLSQGNLKIGSTAINGQRTLMVVLVFLTSGKWYM